MLFYLFIAALLLVLLWLTRVREDFLGSERFIDLPPPFEFDPHVAPDPKKLMSYLRGLLDKYDQPEIIDAIMEKSSMDPRELALMNLQGE
jgi:hypothetical protein